jgi:biopolymer transport protein ExbD
MSTQVSIVRDQLFYFRRRFRQHQRMAGGLLDSAPWVDVVLLIILFMITQTATLKKPGLQVDLPVARVASGARYDAYVLTVPQDGTYFFADEKVPWPALTERLRQVAMKHPEAELIIESDGAVTHRALTGIYNLAVDAGWTKIVLATRIDAKTDVR